MFKLFLLLAFSAFFLPFLIWLFRYLFRAKRVKIVTVIDGDTFIAITRAGKRIKIRLLDADCPELNQRNGPEAKAFAAKYIHKKWVDARFHGRDKYRRHLAHVRVNRQDLATLLIAQGLAYPLGKKGRLQYLSAWIGRKGVHAGFGQRRPWQSARGGAVRYWFKRLRKKRSLR